VNDPLVSHGGTTVRITFGMIVLNGEPFTRYNLRAIYPWAHQIIVVEGACKAAAAVADAKGHSTDGTLDVLRHFQAEENPDQKLTIVTAEDEGHPDGFWPGEKHEMSKAYAKRATGNCLWQVDVDEFYREDDMPRIVGLLQQGVDAVTFPTLSFWGGIQFVEDGEYMRVHKAREYHRLFRWASGFNYATHRPPTVRDVQGHDLRTQRWIRAADLEYEGVYMYHYSMLLPKQVREKCSYYSQVDWAAFQSMERWAHETFSQLKNPFGVCNTLHVPLSWLQEYRGSHPKQILEMIANIRAGRHPNIELRATDDILRVTRTPQYRVARLMRKAWVGFLRLRNAVWSWLARLRRSILGPRNKSG
jgi:hypothetical protein